MRSIVSAVVLMLSVAACGGEIESAQGCEDAGHVVRPAPGPRAECLEGETEVAYVPFGIEGAACCAQD